MGWIGIGRRTVPFSFFSVSLIPFDIESCDQFLKVLKFVNGIGKFWLVTAVGYCDRNGKSALK